MLDDMDVLALKTEHHHYLGPPRRRVPLDPTGQLDPESAPHRFCKHRYLQADSIRETDLNLRPPGPQPVGSGCVGADSAVLSGFELV